MISIILASTKDGLIGNNEKLPWSIPEELKFFKETTTGNIMLMGRKTADTLPCALPKRQSIVLTRGSYDRKGYQSINSVDDLDSVILEEYSGKDIFVIGGAEIYALLIDKADVLYWTEITLDDVEGNVYYNVDFSKWNNKELVRTGDGFKAWKFTR